MFLSLFRSCTVLRASCKVSLRYINIKKKFVALLFCTFPRLFFRSHPLSFIVGFFRALLHLPCVVDIKVFITCRLYLVFLFLVVVEFLEDELFVSLFYV